MSFGVRNGFHQHQNTNCCTQYFGWEMPELCHLPLLRNPDQSKLSKRKNPTSILYYRGSRLFAPRPLLNYLGRMGWVDAG